MIVLWLVRCVVTNISSAIAMSESSTISSTNGSIAGAMSDTRIALLPARDVGRDGLEADALRARDGVDQALEHEQAVSAPDGLLVQTRRVQAPVDVAHDEL